MQPEPLNCYLAKGDGSGATLLSSTTITVSSSVYIEVPIFTNVNLEAGVQYFLSITAVSQDEGLSRWQCGNMVGVASGVSLEFGTMNGGIAWPVQGTANYASPWESDFVSTGNGFPPSTHIYGLTTPIPTGLCTGAQYPSGNSFLPCQTCL